MTSTLGLGWLLANRDLKARFTGSVLGLGWLLLLPLLMTTLYTLVFWGVFQARWPSVQPPEVSSGAMQAFEFGLKLFAGLAAFQFFAEVSVRATRAITDNAPLVKRLQFPAVALVLSIVFSGAVAMLIGLALCVALSGAVFGRLPDLILLGLGLGMLFLMTSGAALLLAALSTYLRDIQQLMPALTAALLFVSPVFYPSSKAPGLLGSILMFNPLSAPIEVIRVGIFVETLATIGLTWPGLAVRVVAALVLFLAGWWVFQRLKSGFADLI